MTRNKLDLDGQHVAMATIGQGIVNLIGQECERAGTNDMNMVLNILASVVAHYIGGVSDHELRQAAYTQFGFNLAGHLTVGEQIGAPCALVRVEGKETVQ